MIIRMQHANLLTLKNLSPSFSTLKNFDLHNRLFPSAKCSIEKES